MKFLFEMLTGEAGRISSKRWAMVVLLVVFVYDKIVNLHTGKQMAPLYSEQLFEILLASIAFVFGEKWIAGWMATRKQNPEKKETS